MEPLWMNKLLEEFDEVLTLFQKSEKYQRYLVLKEKLSKNEKAMKWIEEAKYYQKELVRLEHTSTASVIPTLEKYQERLKRLEELPIYQAYQESQREINQDLQEIKKKIEATLDEILL